MGLAAATGVTQVDLWVGLPKHICPKSTFPAFGVSASCRRALGRVGAAFRNPKTLEIAQLFLKPLSVMSYIMPTLLVHSPRSQRVNSSARTNVRGASLPPQPSF